MKRIATLTALAAMTAMSAGAVEVTTNGGFEAGDTSGWSPFPTVNSTFEAINDGTAQSGDWYGRITNNQIPSGFVVKQANVANGLVNPGDPVNISFWARGTFAAGGVGIAEFFSEIDPSGTSASEILGGGPFIVGSSSTWTEYTYSTVAGPDVSGGITLQFVAANGGDPSSQAILEIDSVSVDVVPEPSSLALLGLGGLAVFRRRRRA